jgi:RNA polymerase sigma-70 factor (ECF subfamily)
LLANEATLIDASQQGDTYAFNRLVEAYQTQVYNLAYRILGQPEPAADATQETFLSAFRHIRQFRGGSFRSWLLSIANSRCYDEFRRRSRSPATNSLDQARDEGTAPDPADTSPTPEDSAMRGELRRYLQEALLTLPYEQRVVVVLSDVQGMPYEEIAEATGVALGTVKSRLSRGRASLRDFLIAARELPGGSRRHA